MTTYIIYRHGSNAANQSMTPMMVLGSIDAASKKDALSQAAERYTCYNNQRFEAKPISRSQNPTSNGRLSRMRWQRTNPPP